MKRVILCAAGTRGDGHWGSRAGRRGFRSNRREAQSLLLDSEAYSALARGASAYGVGKAAERIVEVLAY